MLCSRSVPRSLLRHNASTTSTGPHLAHRTCTLLANRNILSRPTTPTRASSSSSTRWKSRQTNDHYAKEARVAGLKSRAAFKLLELDTKHRLFRPQNTVVDLGYAPGSWSQVAVNRTAPGGRVVGIDIIPAQPPRGASSIQGNFLSREVQDEVRRYVQDYWKGRARKRGVLARRGGEEAEGPGEEGVSEDEIEGLSRGIVELRRESAAQEAVAEGAVGEEVGEERQLTKAERDDKEGRVVDVVLSDMMMNTSGMAFRDHAGSMDLCNAALTFCYSTLRTGGHFLCKFYQGGEDKAFELRLRKLFEKVHREKPESSRPESKEAYFVALRRKPDVDRKLVFPDEY